MPDIFVADPEPIKKEKVPVKVHKLPGHTHNHLTAYCYYPDGVNFSAAATDEKIVLLLRRHPVTNVKWILVSLVMFIIPLVLTPFLANLDVPGNFILLGTFFWYLITIAFTFEKFLSWFFNVNIITEDRVFDVDFVNLVYTEITDADIDNIEDVTVRVGGVIRTLFDYGDVLIQTAAETPEIEFEAVPRPDEVARVLRELGKKH